MEPVRNGWSRVPQAVIIATTALALLGMSTAAAGQALASHRPAPAGSPLPIPAGAEAVPALSSPGPATSCPSVFMIGARGSGEPAGGRFHGLGAAVHKMLSVAAGILKHDRVQYKTYAVNYAALSVNVLKPTDLNRGLGYYYHHNVQRYLRSIVKGDSVTVSLAKSLNRRCPATLMIMAGYSQGAMVIHQAQNKLSHRIVNCFGATLLLGDGDRLPNTRATEFGTSPAKGEGIANWFASVLKLPKGPGVRSWPSTANICNANDIVCDTSLADFLHWSTSAKVHTSYAHRNSNGTYTYERILTSAANWGADLVDRMITGRPGTACGRP